MSTKHVETSSSDGDVIKLFVQGFKSLPKGEEGWEVVIAVSYNEDEPHDAFPMSIKTATELVGLLTEQIEFAKMEEAN